MNKILIENDKISFDNETVCLTTNTKELNITINNEVTINEFKSNNKLKTLNITLNDNAILTYNKYSNCLNNDLNINIILNFNSMFKANMGFIIRDKHNINIKTVMRQSSSLNIINLKAINKDNGSVFILVDGIVNENTKDNIMKEDIRVLNLNDNVVRVYPNMLISTDNVNAMHNNTISGINEDELFYLESKGLKSNDAIKLIEQGFINSVFPSSFIEVLKKEEIL